ncbi:MAG: hypothetical protein ACD_41C00266G0004 [uncultured bacterium]|nr:MAG: hypothetical protein ACD_41C00266G0004 [uncultured bacterium]
MVYPTNTDGPLPPCPIHTQTHYEYIQMVVSTDRSHKWSQNTIQENDNPIVLIELMEQRIYSDITSFRPTLIMAWYWLSITKTLICYKLKE